MRKVPKTQVRVYSRHCYRKLKTSVLANLLISSVDMPFSLGYERWTQPLDPEQEVILN